MPTRNSQHKSEIEFSSAEFEHLPDTQRLQLAEINDTLSRIVLSNRLISNGRSIFITGPWGIGKTRAAYFIANHIYCGIPDLLFKTLVFNHEMIIFSDSETSLRILLSRVADKIKRLKIADLRKEFASLTGAYVDTAQTSLELQLFRFLTISRSFGTHQFVRDSLPFIRQRFAELASDGWRIVLIIDDIDRLKPEDQLVTLHFIQLMRSIPGFVVIVPIEKMIVANGISKILSVGDENGSANIGEQFIERFSDHTIALRADYYFYRTEIFTKIVKSTLDSYFSIFSSQDDPASKAATVNLEQIDFYPPLSQANSARNYDEHLANMKVSSTYRLADLAWQCLQYLLVTEHYLQVYLVSAGNHVVDHNRQRRGIDSSSLLKRIKYQLDNLNDKDSTSYDKLNPTDPQIWEIIGNDWSVSQKTFVDTLLNSGVGNNLQDVRHIWQILRNRQNETGLLSHITYDTHTYLLFELFMEREGTTSEEWRNNHEEIFESTATRRRLHYLAEVVSHKIDVEFKINKIARDLSNNDLDSISRKKKIFRIIFNSCYDAIHNQ